MSVNRKRQELTELTYSKRYCKDVVVNFLMSDKDISKYVKVAVEDLAAHAEVDHEDASKKSRAKELLQMDLEQLVLDILYHVVRSPRMVTVTTIAGLLQKQMPCKTVEDRLTLAAEATVLISATGLIELIRPMARENTSGQWSVHSPILLPEEVQKHLAEAMYLPPMLVEPRKVRSNKEAGHLTMQDWVFTQNKEQRHEKYVSLDVLNKLNSTPLSLNLDLLKAVEEPLPEFKKELTRRQLRQVTEVAEETRCLAYGVYEYLVEHGNMFYMTYRFDSVGRIYAHGHHVNPQGTEFKKACVEFAQQEIVPLD